jgi:hypothetical protein
MKSKITVIKAYFKIKKVKIFVIKTFSSNLSSWAKTIATFYLFLDAYLH